jgi:uncharacterized protein (TIGR02594 family)
MPKLSNASMTSSSLQLPIKYKDLAAYNNPKLLVEGLKTFNVVEGKGKLNNEVIMSWADYTGLSSQYKEDSIPWCGLWMAYVAKRANWKAVNKPLWARNWLQFGVSADIPMLGDILIFSRGVGGHVGLYVGEDEEAFHVLGGNQGDKVSIARISKKRLLDARRPAWRFFQPKEVKQIFRTSSGVLSKNEE